MAYKTAQLLHELNETKGLCFYTQNFLTVVWHFFDFSLRKKFANWASFVNLDKTFPILNLSTLVQGFNFPDFALPQSIDCVLSHDTFCLISNNFQLLFFCKRFRNRTNFKYIDDNCHFLSRSFSHVKLQVAWSLYKLYDETDFHQILSLTCGPAFFDLFFCERIIVIKFLC